MTQVENERFLAMFKEELKKLCSHRQCDIFEDGSGNLLASRKFTDPDGYKYVSVTTLNIVPF